MENIQPDRIHGLQRWDDWLEGRLSPHGIVREKPEDIDTDDAVWRVGFRDDTRARVHVTDQVLRLTDEEFDELVGELEALDWIELLKAARPGGIRIYPDGGIEEMDPEGAEKNRTGP